MAIVNTAAASQAYGIGTNPCALPIAIPTTGADRILLIEVVESSSTLPGSEISSVTCGGYTANEVYAGTSYGNRLKFHGVWALVNPPTGSQTITVTFNTGPVWPVVLASVWTGMDTANPFGTWVTATGSGGNVTSVTVSSQVGQVAVDFVHVTGPYGTMTPGSGQTLVKFQQGIGDDYACSAGHSWEAGAASVELTETFTGSTIMWIAVGASLRPAPIPRTRSVDYSIDINDSAQRIFDPEGNIVPPWAIKADRWLRLSGLYNTGGVVYSSFVDDPAMCYIESVTWDSDAGTLRIVTSRQHLGEIIMAQAAGRSTA